MVSFRNLLLLPRRDDGYDSARVRESLRGPYEASLLRLLRHAANVLVRPTARRIQLHTRNNGKPMSRRFGRLGGDGADSRDSDVAWRYGCLVKGGEPRFPHRDEGRGRRPTTVALGIPAYRHWYHFCDGAGTRRKRDNGYPLVRHHAGGQPTFWTNQDNQRFETECRWHYEGRVGGC